MISLKELNPKNFPTTDELNKNLADLLEKINKVRKAWNKPMKVTSGLRSMEDHKRIYKAKGIEESKIPLKSRHLWGKAVDIADPKGELWTWCQANEALLEEIGLWMEHGDTTKGWCHFQTEAPKSGKRFFYP